jgi:hypothetical protein
VRLANGNTLISDAGFSPMTALQKLNAPYSAYVVGDFTGITPPF